MTIPEKLKSRKLWAFIATALLVVFNALFNLGMPPSDVLYLVIASASYILGQGYVDAKQQPVKEFPVDNVTNSVSNIIQAELAKIDFGNNVPLEKIIEGLMPVMEQALGNLSLTIGSPATSVKAIPASVLAADPEEQTA